MCFGGGSSTQKVKTETKPEPQTDFERLQLDRASDLFGPILSQLGYAPSAGGGFQYMGRPDLFAGGNNPLLAPFIGDQSSLVKPAGTSSLFDQPFQDNQSRLAGMVTPMAAKPAGATSLFDAPFQDDQSRLAGLVTGQSSPGGLGLAQQPGASGLTGAEAYWAANPDVKADRFFGSSPAAAREHFLRHGQAEGRTWIDAPATTNTMGQVANPLLTQLAMQYRDALAADESGDDSGVTRANLRDTRQRLKEFGYNVSDPAVLNGLLQGTPLFDPEGAAAQIPGPGGAAPGGGQQPMQPQPQAQPGYAETLDDALLRLSGQNLLEGMSGQVGVPASVQSLINQVYDPLQARALEDLNRFTIEAAGSRGLNITDSPIGQPMMRQASDLIRDFSGMRAGSTLSERSSQLARSQALREFSEGLQQRQLENLLNLQQQQANFGLGLYSPRFKGGTSNSVTRGGTNPLGSIGGFLGGLGGLATGLGGLFGGAGLAGSSLGALSGGTAAGASVLGMLSSRDFKTVENELSPDEIDRFVEQIEALPIYRWKYLPGIADGDAHVGPVVEEMPEALVKGKMIDIISTIGVLLASVKSLSARVKQLEAA